MENLRSKINDVAKRRGFYWNSYDIYGGLGGFYDYGPLGSLMKKNIVDLWLKEFVYHDGLILVDTPIIGPEIVYRASGHLDKFTDYMVRCKSCGHAFRVDELIDKYVETPDALSPDEIERIIETYNIKCPDCGGELGHVEEFHLMFSTNIDLGKKGFLRPETAQGIFVNFSNLYRINREKLPMGVAQIGRAFRNEISPRQGMLRLREFNMAEIELFVDPESGYKWREIPERMLHALRNDGRDIKISSVEACKNEVINCYISYYMARIIDFLQKLGIDTERVRFREHHPEELAHYSTETWDCEVLLSKGWMEVIGISYRGAYDLSHHMDYSGQDTRAFRRYQDERKIKIERIVPRMEILGPKFKANAQKIAKKLEEMEMEGDKRPLEIEVEGKKYRIPPDAYDLVVEEVKVSGERFIPHVVEPSFGIDRLFYAILEHSYYEREDSKYKVLRFNPIIAPVKAGVFPLMSKDGLDVLAKQVLSFLREKGVNAYYDESGSIGRRYARADEIGTPFCVTVDYQTKEDSTVTVRERDSTEQVRVKISHLVEFIRNIIEEKRGFKDVP